MGTEHTLLLQDEVVELVHEQGNWKLKKDLGFSPVEMLAVSAGACSAYVYQRVLNTSRVSHTFNKATVSFQREEETTVKKISEITITFYLSVEENLQEKARKALKLVAPNCPVIQSLDPSLAVHETVVFE